MQITMHFNNPIDYVDAQDQQVIYLWWEYLGMAPVIAK
jgi:hypothetical protein